MSDSSELVVYTTSNNDAYYLMDFYGRDNSLSLLTWPTIRQAQYYPSKGEKLFRITLTVEEIREDS